MNDLVALNADITDVVDGVSQRLVHVRNGNHGAGAGTIWHAQGLIVTNAHVVTPVRGAPVRGASVRGDHAHGEVQVELADGRRFPAQVLAADSESDLAALRIDATDLLTTRLGDSRAVRPGQWVMALGHPLGITGAATSGVVIGMGKAWPEMPPARHDWLVVSLHMRPGHSGGPLVDVQGRLLGINTMINGPDVGFAIPVHVVVEFLRRSLLK